ncbi:MULTISPECIES: PAS domain-containing sensor histidine kinase [Sphingobacterium]|uniref:histidine kinase n=1 Tax=Sphingobacterium populi TaxID=1812824 RepID=A0ABW5U922_9SPHI|nr:PAS domain S-box protein [Sphingobacterium sp. CFCC 11742]
MEDITALQKQLADLKNLNENLSKRCEYLTDFMEKASTPLRSVDNYGKIIWANQAELDLLGYQKQEYIGKNIADIHSDKNIANDIFGRWLINETVQDYPAKLLHKNGSIKHVLISSNVFRQDDKFIHTQCFTRDISSDIIQKHQTESFNFKLRESEARLRLAIDSTELGTWDWNKRHKIIYWSPECRSILGLSQRGRLSFPEFLKRIHEDDRALIDARIYELINASTDGHFDMTFRIFRINDNQCRWIRAQGTVFVGSDNILNRFLGTMLDVTKTKESHEQHARLAAIVESSDDAIVAKTLDGRVITWNDSAEKLFGYTAKEMIGESLLKIIPQDRYNEEESILRKLRAGESVKHFETLRVKKSGEMVDVSLTISPIRDDEGRITGISKIARDITDRKEEEKRKNDFISVVSHELKTPLTSILLYSQLLMKKVNQKQFGDVKQLTQRVETHSRRMNVLIGNYLDMTRIEQGKAEINLEDFELKGLIQEVVSDAELFDSPHTFIINSTGNVNVNADRDKICQVLTNLVSNAVKYSPSGGQIIISCENKDKQVIVSVKDQGMGISAKDQKMLFQRFYRIKDPNRKNISGFGIGLYLVSELLRLHDSSISIESEQGIGSTFFFSLKSSHIGI